MATAEWNRSERGKFCKSEWYERNKGQMAARALERKNEINARRRQRLSERAPRLIYWKQCWHAKRRGIAWEFDFESWWEVWARSGKWDQRGIGIGKYCMCRFGDVGPYRPTNVYIDLFERNASRKPRGQLT